MFGFGHYRRDRDKVHVDAARAGDAAKVIKLLAKGADVNAKNNDGATSLHYASWNGHTELAEALIAKGANINAKDSGGDTPLHWASANGHADVTKALIAKGADINAKNNHGRTPLDVARSEGKDSVAKLLENAIFVCHSFISPWQYHMILHFDQESHDISRVRNVIATNLRSLLNEVQAGHGNNYNTRNGFNDLGCYLNLCAQEGCARVELCAIDIHHNSMFCMGIRAIYRSIFSNGSTALSSALAHVYCKGYYSDRGENVEVSRLTLEPGEHLAEIRTRQGEITDQITFLTNLRTVSFGGGGGNGKDVSIPVDKTRKIIAFVGTSNGVLERLGAISVLANWEVIGHIVILRELLEKRRASLPQTVSLNKEEAVIQTLVSSVSDDVFKLTLSFLAPGVKISD